MNKIEAEGGEIAIKNKNGDVAIIPKEKVAYVENLIKSGMHSQVDSFVSMLPKMKATAEHGGVHEESTIGPSKRKSNAQLQAEYGSGVKHREIYLDLYDKELPETTVTDIYNIDEDNPWLTGKAKQHQKEYREAQYLRKAWEENFNKHLNDPSLPFKETLMPNGREIYEQAQRFSKIEGDNRDDLNTEDYWIRMGLPEDQAKLRGEYHDYMLKNATHFNKLEGSAYVAYANSPEAQLRSENPATSWKELIENRTDITDKALLYASLMDEGADQFTDRYEGGERPSFSGYGSFGLDTFGQRFDEFTNRGLIDPSMRKRVVFSETMNDKKSGPEKVKTANFTNLDDVITAKDAFLRSGKSAISRKAKQLGVKLSPTAETYFTLAAYNFGEGGARKMLEAYKEAGILENDKFMNDESYPDYREVHRNAKRRVQAINMIRGEKLIGTPKKL